MGRPVLAITGRSTIDGAAAHGDPIEAGEFLSSCILAHLHNYEMRSFAPGARQDAAPIRGVLATVEARNANERPGGRPLVKTG